MIPSTSAARRGEGLDDPLIFAYMETMDIRSHCFLLTDNRITFGLRTKSKS